MPTLADVTVANALTILYLTLLEGILSVDNALALAALVKGRLKNKDDQKKALHYGIIGAYVFRIAVIFAGVWLMHHEWVKWLAALYLIYLAASELFLKRTPGEDLSDETKNTGLSTLWRTIIAVELMDIMFSIDSIAVALSISDVAWVLIAGAILGIFAMRFTAQGFIKLIEKFPILEKTAFILVGMAGLKIVAELLGYAVHDVFFMATMFSIIIASMAIQHFQKGKAGVSA